MKIDVHAVTDRGCLREHNEDRVLIGSELVRESVRKQISIRVEEAASYVVAIADGMGGHQAGEVAAETVLDLLAQRVKCLLPGLSSHELERELKQWAVDTHRCLLEEGERDVSKRGMGTTLVGVLFYEGAAYCLSAGDSRLYRFRDGLLVRLTEDHSLEEFSGGQSRALLNSFGAGATVFLDFRRVRVLEGDTLLLCSDGLTTMLSDEEVEEIVRTCSDPLDELIMRAKHRGGHDNISIVLIGIGSSGEEMKPS